MQNPDNATTEATAQRVYTAADYKATVIEIDANLKRLHAERIELTSNIEFPHIVQGRIKTLEPRITELKTELAEKLAQLEQCHALLDVEQQQRMLEKVYQQIDSETALRKAYNDEYLRLAEQEKLTAVTEKPIEQFKKLAASMSKDDLLAALQSILQTK